MAKQLEIIQSFMKVLNEHGYGQISDTDENANHTVSKKMLDEAVRSCSPYDGIEDAISKFISACDSATGSTEAEKLLSVCGIDVTNEDTGAITGKDAGGTDIKNKDDIVPEDSGKTFNLETDLKTVEYDDGSFLTFTVKDLTVRIIGERNEKTKEVTNFTDDNFSKLPEYQQVIVAGLYKWWIEQPIQLNEDSYNLGFTTQGVTVNQIDVYFEAGTENTLAYVSNTPNNSGQAVHLDLVINNNYYNDITETNDYNGEGTITNDGAGYLDRTLAHEFTHAIMGANINYFSALPMFIKEGMAELTHGVDDTRLVEMKALINGTESLANYVNLTLTSSKQITDETKSNYPYAAGYMFLRWLAKTASESTALPIASLSASVNLDENSTGNFYIANNTDENQTASTDANDVTVGVAENSVYTANDGVKQNITYSGSYEIKNVGSYSTVQADASNENAATIQGNGYEISVKSGAGDDSINVIGNNNSIDAGDGNNTIDSGSVQNLNSYVKTGSGDDSINYSGMGTSIDAGDGNNVINAYIFENNLITLVDEMSIVSGAGNDSIAFAGKNITVKSGAGDDSIDSGKNASVQFNLIDAGDGNDNINVNGNTSTIIGGKGNDSIIFANYSHSIASINANNYVDAGDGDDSIFAYSYGHTIIAGEGNDTVHNHGENVSIDAGAGNDVIEIYNTGDTVTTGEGEDTVVVRGGDLSSMELHITDMDATSDLLRVYHSEDVDTVTSDENKVSFGDTLNIYFDNVSDVTSLYSMDIYIQGATSFTTKKLYQWLGVSIDNFNWEDGAYYFEIEDLSSDLNVKTGDIVTKTPTADKNYVKISYTESTITLRIEVGTFDSEGNLQNSVDYTGTINIDAAQYTEDGRYTLGNKSFTKDANAKYGVSFTNVLYNSVFSNLTFKDTVTTYNYKENYSITVNGKVYNSIGGSTAIIQGDNIGATDGTFTVTNSLRIYNSKDLTVTSTDETTFDGVTVSLENKQLKSITGLDTNEKISIGSDETDKILYYVEGENLIKEDWKFIPHSETIASGSDYAEGEIDFTTRAGWNFKKYQTTYTDNTADIVAAFDENPELVISWQATQNESTDPITVELTKGTFNLNDFDSNYTDGFTYEIVAGDGITLTFTVNNDDKTIEKVVLGDFDNGDSFKIGDVTYTMTGNKITRDSDNRIYSGDLDKFMENIYTDDFWEGVNMSYDLKWKLLSSGTSITGADNSFVDKDSDTDRLVCYHVVSDNDDTDTTETPLFYIVGLVTENIVADSDRTISVSDEDSDTFKFSIGDISGNSVEVTVNESARSWLPFESDSKVKFVSVVNQTYASSEGLNTDSTEIKTISVNISGDWNTETVAEDLAAYLYGNTYKIFTEDSALATYETETSVETDATEVTVSVASKESDVAIQITGFDTGVSFSIVKDSENISADMTVQVNFPETTTSVSGLSVSAAEFMSDSTTALVMTDASITTLTNCSTPDGVWFLLAKNVTNADDDTTIVSYTISGTDTVNLMIDDLSSDDKVQLTLDSVSHSDCTFEEGYFKIGNVRIYNGTDGTAFSEVTDLVNWSVKVGNDTKSAKELFLTWTLTSSDGDTGASLTCTFGDDSNSLMNFSGVNVTENNSDSFIERCVKWSDDGSSATVKMYAEYLGEYDFTLAPEDGVDISLTLELYNDSNETVTSLGGESEENVWKIYYEINSQTSLLAYFEKYETGGYTLNTGENSLTITYNGGDDVEDGDGGATESASVPLFYINGFHTDSLDAVLNIFGAEDSAYTLESGQTEITLYSDVLDAECSFIPSGTPISIVGSNEDTTYSLKIGDGVQETKKFDNINAQITSSDDTKVAILRTSGTSAGYSLVTNDNESATEISYTEATGLEGFVTLSGLLSTATDTIIAGVKAEDGEEPDSTPTNYNLVISEESIPSFTIPSSLYDTDSKITITRSDETAEAIQPTTKLLFTFENAVQLNAEASNLELTFESEATVKISGEATSVSFNDSESEKSNNAITIAANAVSVGIGNGEDTITFDLSKITSSDGISISGALDDGKFTRDENASRTFIFANIPSDTAESGQTSSWSFTLNEVDLEKDVIEVQQSGLEVFSDGNVEGTYESGSDVTLNFGDKDFNSKYATIALSFTGNETINLHNLKIKVGTTTKTLDEWLGVGPTWHIDENDSSLWYGKDENTLIAFSGGSLDFKDDVDSLPTPSDTTLDFSTIDVGTSLAGKTETEYTIKGSGYLFKLYDTSGQNAFVISSDTTILGGSQGDTFTAGETNLSLNGGGGNDTLISLKENVTLVGGAGDDVFSLKAEAKNNVLDGGNGTDTYYLDSVTSVTIAALDPNDVFVIDTDSYSTLKASITAEDGAIKFASTSESGDPLTIKFLDKDNSSNISDFYGLKIRTRNDDDLENSEYKTIEEIFMAGLEWSLKNGESNAFDTAYLMSDNAVLVTLTGLSSDVASTDTTAAATNFTDAFIVTSDNNNFSITLKSGAFSSDTNVTLTASTDISLSYALDTSVDESKTTSSGWNLKDGTETTKSVRYFSDSVVTAGWSHSQSVNDTNTTIFSYNQAKGSTDSWIISIDGINSSATDTSQFSSFTLDSERKSITVPGAFSGGDNTLTVSGAGYILNFEDGTATKLNLASTNTTIIGTSKDDEFIVNNLATSENGSISILGGAGSDTFNLTGLTVTAGSFKADGGAGEDIFNINKSEGLTLAGGDDNDIFSIYGGSKNISLAGNDGDDVFNIDSGTGISLTGGAGSDTFYFNLGNANAVKITDLSTDDQISLSAVATVSIDSENKVLVFTANNKNTTIDLGVDNGNYSDLYKVTVTAGSEQTSILGDLIDPAGWTTSTASNATLISYGRQSETSYFTINVSNTSLSTDTFAQGLSGKVINISSTSLHDLNVTELPFTINGGYSVAIDESSTTFGSSWVYSGTEATLFSGYTENYGTTTGKITISTAEEGKEVQASLSGLKSGGTTDALVIDSGNSKFTIGSEAIGENQITISAPVFTVTLGDSATVLLSSTGTTLIGSNKADTIAAKDLNISGSDAAISISGNSGTDIFNLQGITVSGQGTFKLFGGEDKDTVSISGSSGISANGGNGDDVFYISSSTGLTLNGDGGSDTFIFDVKNNGSVVLADFNTSTDKISLNSALNYHSATIKGSAVVFDGKFTLSFDGDDSIDQYYKATVINGSDESSSLLEDIVAPLRWETSSSVVTLSSGDSNSSTLKAVTAIYGRANVGDFFTISGLKEDVDIDSLKAAYDSDSGTFTISSEMTNTATITLTKAENDTHTYKLVLEDNVKSKASGFEWSTDASVVSYTEKGESAGFSLSGDTLATYTSGTSESKTLFKIEGLNAATMTGTLVSGVTLTVEDSKVSIADSLIGSSQVSVSGDYIFAFTTSVSALASASDVTIIGSSKADTLEAKNLTITSAVSLYGGGGEDIFSLSGISGDGVLYATGAENSGDVFDISSSSGLILSGGAGSDTFKFTLGNAINATITDISSEDKIVLSGSVSGSTYNSSTGVLILGSGDTAVTLSVATETGGKALKDVGSNLEHLKVFTDTNATDGGIDLIDIISTGKWTVSNGTAIYYREYNGGGGSETLMSISGLSTNLTAQGTTTISGLSLNGSEISITNATVFGGTEISISTATGQNFVFVDLTSDVSVASGSAGWTTSSVDNKGYKAEYFAEALSTTYSVSASDKHKITGTLESGNAAIVLEGLASNTGFGTDSISDSAFTIVSANISSDQKITVSTANGYKLTFGDQANIFVSDSGVSIIGSDSDDTIAVASGINDVSISGGKGDDIFNITSSTGITLSGDEGSDTFNFADNSISASIIDLSTDDKISLASNLEGSIKDGNIQFGKVTLSINNVETDSGFTDVYKVTVLGSGSASSMLGAIIDPIEWQMGSTAEGVATISAQYGRRFGDESGLFTITGLSSSTTSLDSTIYSAQDSSITLTDSVLGKNSNATISLEVKDTASETYKGLHFALGTDAALATINANDIWSTTEATGEETIGKTWGYTSTSKTEGYILDSDSTTITYNADSQAASYLTISGLNANVTSDTLVAQYNSDDHVVTLIGAMLTDTSVSISGGKFILGTDVSKPTTTAAHWSGTDKVWTYYTSGTSKGHSLTAESTSLVFSSGVEATSPVTISGLSSTETFLVGENSKSWTLSSSALTEAGATLSIKISDAEYSISTSEFTVSTDLGTIWSGSSGTYTFNSGGTSSGVTVSTETSGAVSTTSLAYSSGVAATDTITLTGLNASVEVSNDKISEITFGTGDNSSVVIVNLGALDSSTTASISGAGAFANYVFSLGADVTEGSLVGASWNSSGADSESGYTIAYASAHTVEGYTLASGSKSIEHISGVDASTFTILGADVSDTLLFSNAFNSTTGVISLSSDVLKAENGVTLSADSGSSYSFAFDNTVQTGTDIADIWNVAVSSEDSTDTVLSYLNGRKTGGYELGSDSPTVGYNASVSGTALITIEGLKLTTGTSTSINGLNFSSEDKKVTISSMDILNSQTVKISSGYTFVLGNEITTSTTTGETWSDTATKGSVIYTAGAITAGYSAENSNISYIPGSSASDTLFTITGLSSEVKASDFATLGNGHAVIINASMLAGSDITLTESKDSYEAYHLSLAADTNDMAVVTIDSSWGTVENGLLFTASGTSTGYSVIGEGENADTIKYYSATGRTTPITISGLTASGTLLTGADTSWTLDSSALSSDKASLTISISDSNYSVDTSTFVTVSQKSNTWATSTGGTYFFEVGGANSGVTVSTSTNDSISSTTIQYFDEVAADKVITLSGLVSTLTVENASIAGITLGSDSDKFITLSSEVLVQSSDNTVSLAIASDNTLYSGYKLKLDDSVTLHGSSDATVTVTSGTINYKSEVQTAGFEYSEDSLSVTYNSNETSLSTFTLSGLAESIESDSFVSQIGTGGVITLTSGFLTSSGVTLVTGDNSTYSLALDDSVQTVGSDVNIWNLDNTLLSYVSDRKTFGYSVDSSDNKKVIYTAADSGAVKFSIGGLSTTALSLADNTATTIAALSVSSDLNVVTINSADVINSNTVTITSGYSLVLGADIATYKEGTAAFSETSTNGNFEYREGGITLAGYEQTNSETISWKNTVEGAIIFTLNGLATNTALSDLTISESVVTITKAMLEGVKTDIVLSETSVSLEAYHLALAEGIKNSETYMAAWATLDDDDKGLLLKESGTSEGFTIIGSDSEADTIKYSGSDGGETPVTISGLATTDVVSVFAEGSSVGTLTSFTFLKTALSQDTNVTVNVASGSEYTFGLEADATVKEYGEHWTGTETVGTYYLDAAGNHDGYTMQAGTATGTSIIGYQSASEDKHYITLTGLGALTIQTEESDTQTFGTASGIFIDTQSSVVTISKEALTTSNVSIVAASDGDYKDYQLSLGTDVDKYTITTAEWTTETSVLKYRGEYYANNGYRLSSDSSVTKSTTIEYGTVTTADVFTISGLSSTLSSEDDWTSIMSEGVITLTVDMLKGVETDVSLNVGQGNYSLAIAEGAEGFGTVAAHWATYNTLLAFDGDSTLSGFRTVEGGQSVKFVEAETTGSLVQISGLNVSEITDTSLTTFSGITRASDSDNSDAFVLTITNESLLGEGDVKIEGGKESDSYTLALSDDIKAAVPTLQHWDASDGKVLLISSSTSKGYSVINEGKTIQYTASEAAIELATITGLQNIEGASVSSWSNPNNKGKLSVNRLVLESATNVSIASSEGHDYKFDLNTDADYHLTGQTFAINEDSVVYTAAGVDQGWKLVDSDATQITLVAEAGKQTFTIGGLAEGSLKMKKGLISGVDVSFADSNTGLTENTNYAERKATITVEEKVLVKSTESSATITYSEGASDSFVLTIGSGAVTEMIDGYYWHATNGTATYYTGKGKYAGFVVEGNSIKYKEQEDDTDSAIATVTGLKETTVDKKGVISGLTRDNSNLMKIATKLIGEGGATVSATENGKASFQLGGKQTLVASSDSKYVHLIGSSSNDVLINAGSTSGIMSGGSGNDSITAGSGGDYISGGKGNDTVSLGAGNDTYVYTSGQDVITGFGSGDVIKGANDNDLNVSKSSTNGDDLVLHIGTGSITLKDMADSDVTVGDVIYHGALVYTADSDGKKLTATVTAGVSGTVENYDSDVTEVNAQALKTALVLKGTNTSQTITGGTKSDSIIGGDGDDYIEGRAGNDTLGGGKGNNTLYGGAGNNVYVHESGNDFIKGYTVGKDSITLKGTETVQDYISSGTDLVLTLSDNSSITVEGAVGKKVIVNNTAYIYGNHVELNAAKTAVTAGEKYADSELSVTKLGYTSAITINAENASSSSLSITGSTKANVITGKKGGSTINGGKGNDTLIGADSASDVFVFNSGEGNDVITNYESGSDIISVNSAISNAAISGDDTILYIGKSALRVVGSKGKTIKVKVADSDPTEFIYGNSYYTNADGTGETLFSGAKGSISLGEKVTTLNGEAAKYSLNIVADKAMTITGGQKADTIKGSTGNDVLDGGKGNDYIEGGKGDDTLTGGAGKDIFAYSDGDGNDVIVDFANGDKIKLLSDGNYTVTSDESDVMIHVGSDIITVKDAVVKGTKVAITNSDGKTSTKVYTANYGQESTNNVAGRTLSLFEDSNFLTDEPDISDISSISDTNYAVGSIQNNVDELTANSTLLAYSEDK